MRTGGQQIQSTSSSLPQAEPATLSNMEHASVAAQQRPHQLMLVEPEPRKINKRPKKKSQSAPVLVATVPAADVHSSSWDATLDSVSAQVCPIIDQHQKGEGSYVRAAKAGRTQRDASDAARQEELEMAMALEASKTSAEQEQRTPADIQSFFQEPTSHLTSEDAVVPEWRNPGIRNDSGENNCFLSALIQCLWGCADFRYLVLSLPAFSYKANPVVTAIVKLCSAMRECKQQPDPLDISDLRIALAGLPDSPFPVGQMGTVMEAWAVLYKEMQEAAYRAGRPEAMTWLFGLQNKEMMHCRQCCHESHQQEYTSLSHVVEATCLASYSAQTPAQTMASTLLSLQQPMIRTCTAVEGCCAAQNAVRQMLIGQAPAVFTLQLNWEKLHEEKGAIAEVMKSLQTDIDMDEMYQGAAEPMIATHYLQSIACFYREHYVALVQKPNRLWYKFDDTVQSLVGDWSDIVANCVSGQLQPALLLYCVR